MSTFDYIALHSTALAISFLDLTHAERNNCETIIFIPWSTAELSSSREMMEKAANQM